MSAKSAHIIRKQAYDLTIANQQQGRRMQQHVQSINLNHVLPAIGAKLDELFGSEEVTVIDKIEIDIGTLKSDTSPKEWVDKILSALEESFSPAASGQLGSNIVPVKKLALATHAIEVWVYFLQNGRLPSDTFFKSVNEVKEELLQVKKADKKQLQIILLAMLRDEAVAQRLSVLTGHELFFILQVLTPTVSESGWKEWFEKLFSLITDIVNNNNGKAPFSITQLKRQAILFVFAEISTSAKLGRQQLLKPLFDDVIEQLFQFTLTKQTENGEFQSKTQNEKVEQKADESNENNERDKELSLSAIERQQPQLKPREDVFIENAGICILAPFLPAFFKNLHLSDNSNFYDEGKQQKAVALLHFLATGETETSEEKLVLAKLLCGWPLILPGILTEEISAREMEEATELLQSVIDHWGVLKSTTPDGLRQGFLQREGKLVEHDDQFLLQVEQKSLDVLLEQIPWTFRMIKMPWMKKPVSVEWY